MNRAEILDSITRFPTSPGVYLMKDGEGRLLYIGKALNLRNRVRSYFSEGIEERYQIPAMMRKLAHIDWIATNTEAEALILEANLIRANKPPYNIDLKDDKHYPYLKLTMSEPFPQLLVSRRVVRDGSKYFGPYTDVTAMNAIVAFSRRVFGLRRCNRGLPLDKPLRPCLYYSIGQCSGACAGRISQEEYGRAVAMCAQFLAGQRNEVLSQLEEQMQAASRKLDFEHAASLRDQIQLIRGSPYVQKVDLLGNDRSVDVFGLIESDRHICLCVLSFREGLLMYKRHFLFKRELWQLSTSGLETIVIQYYQRTGQEPPEQILLPQQKAETAGLLADWFKAERDAAVAVISPIKGKKVALVNMAEKNATLYLAQKILPNAEEDLRDLQKILNLPRTPHVIEAFDISNLGEAHAVAGMVQFREGVPSKANYRRFRMRSVEGQNDFAMMMEAVVRRLSRLAAEGKDFPDLLLIDGGKGQLHAAMQALPGFELPPMIISLAKKEETLFSPWLEEGVILPGHHPVRKLVERIRDEVHRWAVSYHRTLRDATYTHSALEKVEGLGPRRSSLLLRHFGSLRRVREASVEEIAALKGFSAPLARRILAQLSSEPPAPAPRTS